MSVLAAYYAASSAEKLANAGQSRAQTGLLGQQTQQIAPNAEAQRNEEAARAAQEQAGARRENADASQVGANSASTRAQQVAQTSLLQGQAQATPNLLNSESFKNYASGLGDLQPLPDPSPDAPQQLGTVTTGLSGAGGSVTPATSSLPGAGLSFSPTSILQGNETGGKILSKGEAAQGKAKKPGPTDTVPAMLTPGEAVLNKGAVQHYGTDVIEHMNKMGLMRMGAQSETASMLGIQDPHKEQPVLPVDAKDRKMADKGQGKSTTPSGATPQGYATGGVVMAMPKFDGFMTSLDKSALGDKAKQIDPTSYGLGVLHGASMGTVPQPAQRKQPAAVKAASSR